MINHRLKDVFSSVIKEENELESKNHVSSGKLSASILGDPLQWQVLKIMKVPPKPFDDYALGMFASGKLVEDIIIEKLGKKLKIDGEQKEIEYRNTVGMVDFVLDNEPYEVKSVKASKFKRIDSAGDADRSHILQACLYALAMQSPKFHIVYVCRDDFRILTFEKSTEMYKEDVEAIIDAFDRAIATGFVPEFESEEKWRSNPLYCRYPKYLELTGEQATALAKEESDQKGN